MQLSIIGAGWVGVVTAVAFTEIGHTVVCADVNAERIGQLNNGEAPFFEPGLSEMLAQALASGRLRFTLDNREAMTSAEVVFCCVNTPTGSDGVTDLSAVMSVAEDFANHHAQDAVFVIKSTVPAGTAAKVRAVIGAESGIASNPEFLAESTAIRDTLTPSRIVIGADTPVTFDIVKRVYEPIIATGAHVVTCDCTTAEVIKTAANSFLATRISFMNEIANYCNAVGADPMGVAQGMGFDPRIGAVRPGVGYGGGCFPKDVTALLSEGERAQTPLTVLRATHEANYRQRTLLFDRLQQALGGLNGKRVAVLGLAFKPKTDDVRDAPALTLIQALCAAGATVTVYDPQVKTLPQHLGLDATFATDVLTCVQGVDAVALMCEWQEFYDIDLLKLKEAMSGNVLVDGRYVWSRKNVEALGFNYVV